MFKFSEGEELDMASADRSTLFINATVLDGSEHMEPQPDMAVAVERGVITWIGPSAVAQAPAGAEVIDLAGAYLMPGLINMHVHLCGSGKPVSAGDAGALMKKLDNPVGRAIVRHILKGSAQQQLASGVTTVRGAGDPLFADIAVRNAIDAGKYQGPRLVAPGTGVTVPGGHGAGLFAQVANTPDEAAQQVRDLYARGADVIKLFVTGGVFDATEVGEPGVLRMQPELVKAACGKAHSLGMIVAAHVESPEGVMAALQNGVDSIEHGAQPNVEMIALFKQRKAFQISTISPALPYALFDRSISHATYEQQENGKIVFDGIVALAKANLAAGVPVGLGTDVGCPYSTHYDMWRELHYFVKYCGVTPAFALYSATKLNARLAGIGDLTGSIEADKQADLIVCSGNPLQNLSALRELDMVVKGGYRIDKPQIKKMDEVERELDKFL